MTFPAHGRQWKLSLALRPLSFRPRSTVGGLCCHFTLSIVATIPMGCHRNIQAPSSLRHASREDLNAD